MDLIKEQLKNPIVTGVAGLVIGTLFGLIVLGWWLWPVQWTDASPSDLTYEYQEEYLRMAIDSFSVNGDAALAHARYNALGEDAASILVEIANNPVTQSPEVIAAYGMVVVAEPLPTAEPGVTPQPTEVAAEETSGGGLASLLPFLCVFGFLLIALVGAGYYFYTRRMAGPEQPVAPPPPEPDVEYAETLPVDEEQVEPAAPVETAQPDETAPPVVQYMASYKLGDELYDDSFSIDSQTGEFLGECGAGISETIGVGETQKVTAFEVWLFDKNDIQTVTKVLMSAHAYNNDETRGRLAAKGEPIQVSPGSSTVLETQTLYMIARVVDMGYGDGAMPPESYFERFIVELSVWSKPA